MKILTQPAFRLLGLKLAGKTSNEGRRSAIDCGNLWQRFINEKIADQIPGKQRRDTFAVYYDYDGDHTQPFSYFIGCKVEDGVLAPDGLDTLSIPQHEYVRVIAKGKMPDCVAAAWSDIWQSKISRAYQHDFEVYNERSQDWNNAEIDIFVSVLR